MPNLTAAELVVMQVLWEHGEMKPTEIQEVFPRPIKNAALRFTLRLLLEKKHVSRRKVGNTYYYKTITPRKGAFKKMAKRMAKTFNLGSTAGLIAELIETEELTHKEIRELQKIAAAKAADKKKKGAKK